MGFRGPGAKGGAWIPGMFTPTEHWAALLDDSGWGMGVINFDVTQFLGGFSGKPGAGGPDDPQTGYIAPVKAVDLPNKGDYTFEVAIVLGNASAIRAEAAARRPGGSALMRCTAALETMCAGERYDMQPNLQLMAGRVKLHPDKLYATAFRRPPNPGGSTDRCDDCAGQNQSALRAKGCTNVMVERWCQARSVDAHNN